MATDKLLEMPQQHKNQWPFYSIGVFPTWAAVSNKMKPYTYHLAIKP